MKAVTGKVRLVYIHLKEKSAPPGSDTPRFNVCMLIDKDDTYTLDKLRKAYDDAVAQGKLKCDIWKKKKPAGLTFDGLLRDMEEDSEAEWAENKWGINPKTDYDVKVVDRQGKPVELDDCYNGMYARVSISSYFYGHPAGGKGVAWNLNSIQMLKGGEVIEMNYDPSADYDNEDDDYEYDDDDYDGDESHYAGKSNKQQIHDVDEEDADDDLI